MNGAFIVNTVYTVFLLEFGTIVDSAPEYGYYEQVRIAQGNILGSMRIAARCRSGPSCHLGEKYYEFLGIPYAQPPVGPLRFKSPHPANSWTGVREAITPGSECLQSFTSVTGSEDCLYINVYTPDVPRGNFKLKPVMVWIHGGAFKLGNGYSNLGPEYIVSKKVLLVTFNYRLGVFGFLSLEDKILSGNYGMKDQVQALHWVQTNIEQFGGDPKNVTIFGQSAGAACVHYHLHSPLSKGLFQQAIIQSGTALSPWAFNPNPKATAVELAQVMGLKSTDPTELHDFFMNAKATKLTQASDVLVQKSIQNVRHFNSALFVPCAEVSDSEHAFITQSPSQAVQHTHVNVPLIMGTLSGDGSVLLYAKVYTEHDFKILNKFSDWLMPLDWGIKTGPEKESLGKKIKQYFFSGDPISFDTINSLVDYFTDSNFLMGAQHLLTEHIKKSNVPIYIYEFKLSTTQSNKFIINQFQKRELELYGAAHSDELPLLFSENQNLSTPVKTLKSNTTLLYKEEEISDKMVNMWTNFAKNGNPNYDNLEVEWIPVKDSDYSFLEIDSSLNIKTGKVQQQRLEFWHNLCISTSTSYNCDNL